MEKALKLLNDLLSIPSVNGRDDEGAVAEYLYRYFNEAGIPARLDRIDDRHANVMAVLRGDDTKPPMIWNGHLDTVPYGKIEEWSTDPACPVQKDGFICARGASDMKSGLAAMVYALCSFFHSGREASRTIYFIGTCDEEKNGLGAEHALLNVMPETACELLVGEPTGCRMGVAQKGCLWLEMHVMGRTSHGAYPQEGCNAVEEAVSLADGLRKYAESFSHPVLGKSTAQITQITGGVAPNMTPDECVLLMDMRLTPGLTSQMILEKAKEMANERQAGTKGVLRAEFSVRNDRRAIELDPAHPFAGRLKRCIEAQGLEPGLTGINYFTDASILTRGREDMAVLLFGPGEADMAHKPNERVELKKYQKAIDILTDLITAEVAD